MKTDEQAKESQNQQQIDDYYRLGPVTLGPWTSHIWRHDLRHIGFLLARYKFCAKMLAGKVKVLEVGCGDASGSPVVAQTVGHLCCVDFEPLVVKEAIGNLPHISKIQEGGGKVTFLVHDMTLGPINEEFDAAFCLDVIEHIPCEAESAFLENICASLCEHGVLIIGTPNITSNEYASPASKIGHINLKSAQDLNQLLQNRFHNVFVFSMNDEVVHTGFYPMAHYLLGMGVGVKPRR